MLVESRRPAPRWRAPVGILVALLAGGAITVGLTSYLGASLPSMSPNALLADVRALPSYAASGTISERADLDLPTITGSSTAGPSTARSGTAGSGDTASDFDALEDGSHTLRAWFDGPTRVRVALLDALSESDVIRNGSDFWVWSSRDNAASHAILPEQQSASRARASKAPLPSLLASGLPQWAGTSSTPGDVWPAQLPRTPPAAAAALVAALGPSTSVTLAAPVSVADRDAYSLVIEPTASTSLIASIRIAIDGERHMPLRVQVFAKQYASPAFETGFTHISFDRPDRSMFAFNPPPGTTVTSIPTSNAAGSEAASVLAGSGWTTVMTERLVQPNVGSLPAVVGMFGAGRLLETRLVNALILSDGQVIFGAVEPAALIEAADRSAKPS